MTRIPIVGVWMLCVSVTVACGRTDRANNELDIAGNDIDRTQEAPISETGCLTSSGGRFVLTSLETSNDVPAPQTELYQLIGADDELRQHVGRIVRVNGEAEPARVTQLRETSPAAPAGTSGDDRAQVQTESQTRIETRRLRVSSVTPTGDDCD